MNPRRDDQGDGDDVYLDEDDVIQEINIDEEGSRIEFCRVFFFSFLRLRPSTVCLNLVDGCSLRRRIIVCCVCLKIYLFLCDFFSFLTFLFLVSVA